MVRPNERVNIYIDGSNLYGSLRSRARRTDLDFLAFALKLAASRPLQRVYYYNSLLSPAREPIGPVLNKNSLTNFAEQTIWS